MKREYLQQRVRGLRLTWRRLWASLQRRYPYPEHWLALGLAIAGLVIFVLILAGRVRLYGSDIGGDPHDYSNRLYLLSSLVQALAAILALLVSFTLVATQLAAEAYSPRVVGLRLHDPWLRTAVVLYLVAILWAAFFQGWLKPLSDKSTDIALLLAAEALLYLVPFTLATLRSLGPKRMAEEFVRKQIMDGLDDMIRKAAQADQISVIRDAFEVVDNAAGLEMKRGRRQEAFLLAHRIFIEGYYLAQRKNLEGYEEAMKRLANWANQFRQAGDIEAANQLEEYRDRLFQEWLGGPDERAQDGDNGSKPKRDQ